MSYQIILDGDLIFQGILPPDKLAFVSRVEEISEESQKYKINEMPSPKIASEMIKYLSDVTGINSDRFSVEPYDYLLGFLLNSQKENQNMLLNCSRSTPYQLCRSTLLKVSKVELWSLASMTVSTKE